MLDPGAIGTLLIGLDRARREFEPDPAPRRRRPSASRSRGHVARHQLARALSLLASRLDSRHTADEAATA